MVTGTFRHASAHVLDLQIDGLPESIGATANHPFWSEDRQEFVRADELEIGERLRTLHGTARLVAAVPRAATEPVYNLEVQTGHVYHVGDARVLVHNGRVCPKKTLAEWLKNEPDLLDGAREMYKKSPKWQGIYPDVTPVFYRSKAEVDVIRAKAGESGGHHPHGLALGGPEGQTLTVTNETRQIKNPLHSAATGTQRRIINKIKAQQ